MEGCAVWIVIFALIALLVSYGLDATMLIIFYLTLGVLVIGGIAMSFSIKHDDRKKQKLNEISQQKIEQLLSIIEQCGGSTQQATRLANSPENGWDSREDFMEWYLLLSLAIKVIVEHDAVLTRKRNQGVYTDDYGHIVSKRWDNELNYFIKNVFINELHVQCLRVRGYPLIQSKLATTYLNVSNDEIIKYWAGFAEGQLEAYQEAPKNNYDEEISGHEYENFVAELIETTGWSVVVTKGSGDHGADIIAELDSMRIAIQCKKYESPVGNKSVQEAFSGAKFYDCYFGCVVSNADFTPAARQAATKLQVRLFHHDEVSDYFTSLKNTYEREVEKTNSNHLISDEDGPIEENIESYLSALIESAGWTPILPEWTEAFGMCVIAELDQIRIVIQCKWYLSSVSDKSIDIVSAACQLYGCTFGCIVTHADLSPAARENSIQNGVPILNRDDITDYLKSLKNSCEKNVPNSDSDASIPIDYYMDRE